MFSLCKLYQGQDAWVRLGCLSGRAWGSDSNIDVNFSYIYIYIHTNSIIIIIFKNKEHKVEEEDNKI